MLGCQVITSVFKSLVKEMLVVPGWDDNFCSGWFELCAHKTGGKAAQE